MDDNVLVQDGVYNVELIQTTINVNPGNSGYSLMNDNGDVIGIVSSMLQGSYGMSFAISSKIIENN